MACASLVLSTPSFAHPATKKKDPPRCASKRCHKRVKLKRHFPYCSTWRCIVRAKNRERRRQIDRLTPYGKWAIPAYIVMCESHGSWTAYNPSGARGPYQLMPFWNAPWPVRTQADRDAHHRIAARLWNGGRGASNWVCA